MAAGKISVLRRGDRSHISRKVSVCEDFGFVDNLRSKSETNVNSEYESGKRGVLDNVFNLGNKEVVDDGTVLSPPQKRRKFSPILRDEDDTINSLSSSQELNLDDDQEPGQLDEEDFTRAPNILMSRWAFDDDLEDYGCREKGEVLPIGEESKRRSSSPESGVTQKEGSDISGSEGEGFFGSDLEDDCVELDVSDDDEDLVSYESKSTEAGVIGEGRRNMLQGSRSVFDYEKLGKISEGSYGIVYKARDKETGEIVALKKMKMEDKREGFPVNYLREINTITALNHPSIVNVREVVVDDNDSVDGFDSIYMVMNYVEHDLKALMKARRQPFRQSEVKSLMLQLLEGVKYLHDNWVLHRDLKTSNLLINNKGELKICDFGMSRQYGSPLKPYTALVVTLWYRAPELLLGAKAYSTAVDMWSIGCIMAELLTNKPLFDGKTEYEQLDKIFRTLGTPNEKIWPGYSQLPGNRVNFVNQPYNQLHKKFPRASFTDSPTLSDLGLDLLSRLLTYDPEKRITAEDALNHPWFQDVTLPPSGDLMSSFTAEKVVLTR